MTFLNYTFNVRRRNYNWVLKEITKSFFFFFLKSIFKKQVYLEPSQTSKIEPFVKIVGNFMPLAIFTKSSILDVWLGSKNASTSFSKSFCQFNFFSFSSHLVYFSYYFINFYFFKTRQWCLIISKEVFIILI